MPICYSKLQEWVTSLSFLQSLPVRPIFQVILNCCCCLVAQFCLMLVTPQIKARQAPVSMGFPRQEYWSGLPFPSLGDLPHLGIKPTSLVSPVLQEDSLVLSCQCESESFSVEFYSLGPHGLYSPWNYPGQNTGVGSPSLLQGIFPTQGSNPCLPHCRQIVYQLSHGGSPYFP